MSVAIKDIRESPRRPGRYLLSLSDGRQLLVGVAVLSETGATRAGVALSDEVLARLVEEHHVTALVDRALGYLARGRRSRRELEQRLRRLDPTPGRIARALDRLEATGVLSDEAVAQAEASARLRRGEAPARVRQRLHRKGVTGRLATDAISGAIAEEGFDERGACLEAARKRARTLRTEDPAAARRRLLGFLLRRGFGGDVARAAVREVLRGAGGSEAGEGTDAANEAGEEEL